MPTHEMLMKNQSLQKYPAMNPDIICTATYYDAWMPSPERICIDLLRDAESLNQGSHALNYISAVDAKQGEVVLRDELNGETFAVRPQVVVNAGGPWIDFINRAMDQPTRFIGGTKGSHVILDNPTLRDACKLDFMRGDARAERPATDGGAP